MFSSNQDIFSTQLSSLQVGERLSSQLRFIKEIDALKNVLRHTLLIDGSRRENDAEHSWEMSVMAMVLREYFAPGTDISRVIQMLLVHDLVEIYAGDTFVYDEQDTLTQAERELRAADVIFGLLPAHQNQEFRGIWEEFEARQTPESLAAKALDRFQPLFHSYLTEGKNWRTRNICAGAVRKIMSPIADGSTVLSSVAESIITESIKKGYLFDDGKI